MICTIGIGYDYWYCVWWAVTFGLPLSQPSIWPTFKKTGITLLCIDFCFYLGMCLALVGTSGDGTYKAENLVLVFNIQNIYTLGG